MVILILSLLGLMFGSFVNALVWRLHEQEGLRTQGPGLRKKKTKKLTAKDLSITKGRSMCTHCHHQLSALDLIPVFSWVGLRGKCRYCGKKIEDTPFSEVMTSLLFVGSYIWWPLSFNTMGTVNFVVWCAMLTGFMALLIYDMRWMILPNRIVYPLAALAGVMAVLNITVFHGGLSGLRDTAISVLIAGGLFWGLFELSKGKWIGGGDVKLGFIIGLIVPVPLQAFLVLFFASFIGTVIILPGMATKKLTAKSHVPFGPFLIVSAIIVRLFGASIIAWYRRKYLLY